MSSSMEDVFGERDYDMFFKYLEVAMLDNKVRIAICFPRRNAQNSGPVSCCFNTWMDLAVHLMPQSLLVCTCKIRMVCLWKCFVN